MTFQDHTFHAGVAGRQDNKGLFQQQPTPKPPKPPRNPLVIAVAIAAIVIAILAVISIIGMLAERNEGPQAIASFAEVTAAERTYSAPTATATRPPAAPKDPLKKMNGQYLVGTGPGQVAPGTYSFEVTSYIGYWARCEDVACDITMASDVGLLDNDAPTGPGYLVIEPTDKSVIIKHLSLTKENE